MTRNRTILSVLLALAPSAKGTAGPSLSAASVSTGCTDANVAGRKSKTSFGNSLELQAIEFLRLSWYDGICNGEGAARIKVIAGFKRPLI